MHALRFSILFSGLFLLLAACSPTKKTTKPGEMPTGSQSQLRQKIVTSARQQIGTTYKYAGKTPKTGFDCSGFTSYIFDRHNVRISPASSKQAFEGHPIALEKVQPGDLVFFGEGKKVSHVALVARRTRDGIICIHSTTSRGVIEENVSQSTYWKSRILFARDVLTR